MAQNTTTPQRLCVWAGPLMFVVVAVGFLVLARYLPPPSAQETAAQVAERLSHHTNVFRLGMALMMVGFALLVPWAIGIATRVQLPEGRIPVLTYVQLGSAAVGSVIGQGAAWIFEAAVYRLGDTSPDIVRALHDLAWFTFLAPWPSFTVWCFALALAIFRDHRAQPGLPRWTAYLCIWSGVLFVPACTIFWFKSGPLAWNGAISFYIPFCVFFAWVVGMTIPALVSLRREDAALADDRASDEPCTPVEAVR